MNKISYGQPCSGDCINRILREMRMQGVVIYETPTLARLMVNRNMLEAIARRLRLRPMISFENFMSFFTWNIWNWDNSELVHFPLNPQQLINLQNFFVRYIRSLNNNEPSLAIDAFLARNPQATGAVFWIDTTLGFDEQDPIVEHDQFELNQN